MEPLFTKDHSWVVVAGGVATVGITDYAQAQLGDISFAEVPPPGTPLERGKEAATLESVKAAMEIVSPLTGTVTEGNAAVEAEPSLVNVAPEGAGWLFRLAVERPAELDGLLDAERYRQRVALL